jgi:hypothetical protein
LANSAAPLAALPARAALAVAALDRASGREPPMVTDGIATAQTNATALTVVTATPASSVVTLLRSARAASIE